MVSQDGFDEDSLYDQFPSGDSDGFGFDEGFNRWVHVNDPSLFTAEALQNPAIQAFVNAPFHVTYAQFKSSHRESEYFVHKPHRAMSGDVKDINGVVEGISGSRSTDAHRDARPQPRRDAGAAHHALVGRQWQRAGGPDDRSRNRRPDRAVRPRHMACPSCGARNAEAARFCGLCGARLTSTCPHCQADVHVDLRFCSACGRAMPEAGGAEPTARRR